MGAWLAASSNLKVNVGLVLRFPFRVGLACAAERTVEKDLCSAETGFSSKTPATQPTVT